VHHVAHPAAQREAGDGLSTATTVIQAADVARKRCAKISVLIAVMAGVSTAREEGLSP
jgi:hypothetical protein